MLRLEPCDATHPARDKKDINSQYLHPRSQVQVWALANRTASRSENPERDASPSPSQTMRDDGRAELGP